MAIRIVDGNNFVRLTSDPLGTNYTNYTICGWYQLAGFGWSGTRVQQFAWCRSNVNDNGSIISSQFYRNSATQYYLTVDDYLPSGGALEYVGTWDDSYSGQWWHLAFVRSTTNPKRRIHINGVLVASQDNSETYAGATTGHLFPGLQYRLDTAWRGQPFLGGIFDFRVYNTALSADSVAEIAARKGQDAVFGTSLIRRVGILNGNAGDVMTACYDHSQYKTNGAINGSPLVVADPFPTVKGPRFAA